MGRRLLLVGLFAAIEPGSVLQIVLATLVCTIYLFVQVQAMPYADLNDNFLASCSSVNMLLVFLCAIVY